MSSVRLVANDEGNVAQQGPAWRVEMDRGCVCVCVCAYINDLSV